MNAPTPFVPAADPLVIAGRGYRSRLLTGTGKFRDLDQTRRATDAADAEIVTVAIRRTNIGQNPDEPNLLDVLPPDRYTILPNTAGCYTAADAERTCRLARELLDGHKLVKLEVLGDQKTLFPDVVQTLAAAEQLVADGFDVMVYTSDDPILAKRLEEIGCDGAVGADQGDDDRAEVAAVAQAVAEEDGVGELGGERGRGRQRQRAGQGGDAEGPEGRHAVVLLVVGPVAWIRRRMAPILS